VSRRQVLRSSNGRALSRTRSLGCRSWLSDSGDGVDSVPGMARQVIASVTVALIDAGSTPMTVRLSAREKSESHGAFPTTINSAPTEFLGRRTSGVVFGFLEVIQRGPETS
jgi:hypothetical protein